MNFLESNKFYNSIEDETVKLLVRLHIEDYSQAYKINADKTNQETLAKYGKGNTKRNQLLQKNKELLSNESSLMLNERNYLETINAILEMIVDSDKNKLALLLIGTFFIYKPMIKSNVIDKYAFRPSVRSAFNDLVEFLDFYSSTHVSKGKIANSLAIVLFNLLVKCTKHNRTESIQFIQGVVNTYVDSSNTPKKLRADYIEKYPVYIAGTYNGLPIFQYDTSVNQKYYSEKELIMIQDLLKQLLTNQNSLQEMNHIGKQKDIDTIEKMSVNMVFLEEAIQSLPAIYSIKPMSLVKYHQKTAQNQIWKFFLKRPIYSIKVTLGTILTNLYTKITR